MNPFAPSSVHLTDLPNAVAADIFTSAAIAYQIPPHATASDMKHKRQRSRTQQPLHQSIDFELEASDLSNQGQHYQHAPEDSFDDTTPYWSRSTTTRKDLPEYPLPRLLSAALEHPPEQISFSLDLSLFDVWELVPFFHEFTRRYPHATFAVQLLEWILTHNASNDSTAYNARACQAAIRRLRPRSDDAIPHLLAILQALPPSSEQRSLLFAIGTMGQQAAPLLPHLYHYASDPDPEVCAQAAHTLSLLGPRDPLVLQCLQRILQRSSLTAQHRRPSPQNHFAQQEYTRLLQPILLVQHSALLALDRMGEMARTILDDVQSIAFHDHIPTIKAWSRIIGKFQHNPDTNLPILRRFIHHTDLTVQESAILALGKFGSQATNPTLLQRLLLFATQPQQKRRWEATLRALAKLCTPSDLPVLYTTLQQYIKDDPFGIINTPLLQHPPQYREYLSLFLHTLSGLLHLLSTIFQRYNCSVYPCPPDTLSAIASLSRSFRSHPMVLWRTLFSMHATTPYETILRSFQDFFLHAPTQPDLQRYKDFEDALF